MKLKNIREDEVSVEELMYLYLTLWINYDQYVDMLFKKAETDSRIVDLMVNYNVEKGYEEVSEYIGCYAKDVDSKKLHAKAIILINREYPFTEYENLKKIDVRFQLPFDVVYFLYGLTDRVIVDELYNKKILSPTGDCTRDMKTVIKYYEQLIK